MDVLVSLDDQIYAMNHLMMEESSRGVYNITAPYLSQTTQVR